MSNEIILNVNKREVVNKGQRKRLRKEGKIPGIYYSHNSRESIPFYIEINELIRAQKSEERIFDINVGSKKRSVLFKSVQYHPVTDEIIHIDLYGIKMDQTVTVNVNLELTGTAKGVTEGGIVVQTLNELEIECLPMDIPKVIQLDVSELEIGQNLKVENIILDEKITAISKVEQIVVSVTQAMKEEELIPEVEEDELLEGEEGETPEGEEGETETPKEDSKGDESASQEDTKDSKG